MAVILQISHRLGRTEVLCPGVEEGRKLWDLFQEANDGGSNKRDVLTARLSDGTEAIEFSQYPVVGALRGSSLPSDPDFDDSHPSLRRTWDVAYPVAFRQMIRRRRFMPDGSEYPVKDGKRKQTNGGAKEHFVYPWGLMGDGDYFITKPMGWRQRERLKVGMRQAASRYDIELAFRDWSLKNEDTDLVDSRGQELLALRVTRVCGFTSVVKEAANMWLAEEGRTKLQIADPASRSRRDWSARKAARIQGPVEDEEHTRPVVEPGPEIPQGDPYAGMNERERNRAKLAEMRARYAQELGDDE